MTDTPDQIKFSPGTIVATMGATQVASLDQIRVILDRHLAGDWGDLSDDDKRANEAALEHGDRLVSRYDLGPTPFLVITEWDRSATTVMLRDEY